MNFTDNDIQQIEAKGLTVAEVESQINIFKSGIPYTNISEAATLGNGITKLNTDLIEAYTSYFEKRKTLAKGHGRCFGSRRDSDRFLLFGCCRK